jgi:hypothetical protein
MAGGDTQVGGNGSVYWRSSHYDDHNRKKKLKLKDAKQQLHGSDEIDCNGDEACGRDGDTPVTEVGARLGHKGYFLVTLRYRTMKEAEDAGAWVAQNVRPGQGGFLLTIRVPAIQRETPEVDPPYEVKVEW